MSFSTSVAAARRIQPSPFAGRGQDVEPEWTYNANGQDPSRMAKPGARAVSPLQGRPVPLQAMEAELPAAVSEMSSPSTSTRQPSGRNVSGRNSPGRRGSGTIALDQSATSQQVGDDIHTALMKLEGAFPVVQSMQRINLGFYRLEGQGTFELSLARNSDKLFVKLDSWNRGVRGELIKFLQSMRGEGQLERTPSEQSLARSNINPQERSPGGSTRQMSPSSGAGQNRAMPKEGYPSSAAQRRSPVRKAAPKPAAAKSGSRKVAGQTPPAPLRGEGGASRFREGAIFAHAREPLLGDPVVAIRISEEPEGLRALTRLLCSGRTMEVRGPCLVPLDVRPPRASSSCSALANFEEIFFIGDPEEMSAVPGWQVFGNVELAELTSRELPMILGECWPPEQASPMRGLIWTLRPFLIDWLQRRQRLRHFSQLVVSLPEALLRRFSTISSDVASVQSLLLDLTERDLLVAVLLSTPPEQRSRLYAFAAEAGLPLPLAFSGIRCPCPPAEVDRGGDLADSFYSQVDRGVTVHWEAFEGLLALPCERPLLLSIGAHGCAQLGKSGLLKELLGLEATVVDQSLDDGNLNGRGPNLFPACRSPAHAPGVDLLRSSGSLGWTADVHGAGALGDPAWMALIATLASTSPLVFLHVSTDDFVVQIDDDRAPQQQPGPKRAAGPGASRKLQSASTVPATASAPGQVRVTAKPDLLVLLKLLMEAQLPGIGTSRTRILIMHRDAGTAAQHVASAIQACLEAYLGSALAGLYPLERLTGLAGAHRQRALARLREKLQQELYLLEGSADVPPFPCLDSLRSMFNHFYDRLTLAGDRAIVPSEEFTVHRRRSKVFTALLDDALTRSKGRLRDIAFPVSEAAAQLARLKVKEKQMLEADANGEAAPSDALLAQLSAQLRELEKGRRALLAQPMSPLVRFFLEIVMSGPSLSHAQVAELGASLAAWRGPRLRPLTDQRRELLDQRLHLHQEMRGKIDGPRKNDFDALTERLAAIEDTTEQLSISLDSFWEEVAAISDLSTELQGLGLQVPPELPEPVQLKRLFAEWAWQLNMPVQLLYGSPLRCAGNFLVEVLKDLGAEYNQELFVISVIGIQSSAKSTLLNFLFGSGFATSAGRCTKGLYCSLMEARGRTILILDTEGLMSLEAQGGDVFDAQLALMAMACSHLVLINHKGELSRQLQDLLEVCLFAMQHLKVCRIQPKLLFVLRDQHDRSHSVHGDALRLMRKHLAEASSHLSLRLDELISLDPGSVFLLPSAFASDLEPNTGREVRWCTELFAHEALRLRRKIFQEADELLGNFNRGAQSDGGTPEFSTLPDWCLHSMSVWRVLDRYGPNLLHYKTIQEIEIQRELEELVKQISSQLVRSQGGLADECKALLSAFTERLGQGESGDKVDAEFRTSLQAILERFDKKGQAELESRLQSRRSKLPEAKKAEAKRKLTTPLEYQGELTRYTWALCLTDAVDRDQLRALKVHFKATIERLWQSESSQSIAEGQARRMFDAEWKAFEDKCRERFSRTTRTKKQLAEEVCLVFNHALRQHRHGDEALHVLELVAASTLLGTEPFSWRPELVSQQFLEVRQPAKLREYAAQRPPDRNGRQTQGPRNGSDNDLLQACIVPEIRRHLTPVLALEIPDKSTQMPSEDQVLEAMKKLNEAVLAVESRFLVQLGVRLRGGNVDFLNVLHLGLRHSVLDGLVQAEARRTEHQWQVLQSHKQHTEAEFIEMVQRRTTDSGRAKMLAELFFDALAREWLDETLVAVAADIRGQCLADMPDASGAAERAYQQAFVERNWDEVMEYVLDANAYLRKIFTSLFEDRKVAIIRVQRPQIASQLGSFFDALTGGAQRWGTREGARRSKLSSFQATIRSLAAETRSGVKKETAKAWPLLSERFPVVADFDVEDPARFAQELGLELAKLLGEAKVEGLVAEKLEGALQKQQTQVWSLIKGCSATCPCCGSKCDRVGHHTHHKCSHHLLPAFNGWRVAGSCEAALDTCLSSKNHEAPKRSDFSDHLYPNLQEYLQAEHPEWLPFPKEDRALLADSVLKAAWVNCRLPLLQRYDMVDSTLAEWNTAYEEPHRMLQVGAVEEAEEKLIKFGYNPDAIA